MATSWAARLVTANTRDGVDTRNKENCEGLRTRSGDNLSVEKITVLGCSAVTNWGDMMTGMYQNQSNLTALHCKRNPITLYTDMADEPWKYGDDIFVWVDMDEQLRAGPERNAVESYWTDREARKQANQLRKEECYMAQTDALRYRFRLVAQETANLCMSRWINRDIKRHVQRFKSSATKIQALVRGYQVRCRNPHLDCSMCLSHCISPIKKDVGNICRDCAEMGPYKDIVENDSWNWHRC